MIFITGDVHVHNPNYWEQKGQGSNIRTSLTYLKILKKYNLSCTLFINGKCLNNELEGVKKILEFDVELGGHTYDNFEKLGIIKSYVYRKIWNCIYGPVFYQKKDIKRTRIALEKQGLKMASWRTHAFGSNNKTFRILRQQGVRYVSDLLGNQIPFEKEGVIHMPINTPVDQNTIAYGPLDPKNRDPFASCTKGRIKPEEWFEIVKKRVIENEKKGIPSILLIHPATMAYLDNFKLFEKLVKFLSKYKCAKISEFKI